LRTCTFGGGTGIAGNTLVNKVVCKKKDDQSIVLFKG
jgi:hypothetical protein